MNGFIANKILLYATSLPNCSNAGQQGKPKT